MKIAESSTHIDELMIVLLNDKRNNVRKFAESYFKVKEKNIKEIKRVRSLYEFDRGFNSSGFVAGVDEVGRGPLAGPIVAAAVILDLNAIDEESLILKINDSKKVSVKERERLSEIIKEKAISYSIYSVENTIIDVKGIAFANNEVFKGSCNGLKLAPKLVLSDGFPIKGINFNNKFIIKGDTKSASIACASIIAKVYRDNLMKEYSKNYPNYKFENNSGYGTSEHIEAIKKYGICPIHRKSFLSNLIHF